MRMRSDTVRKILVDGSEIVMSVARMTYPDFPSHRVVTISGTKWEEYVQYYIMNNSNFSRELNEEEVTELDGFGKSCFKSIG